MAFIIKILAFILALVTPLINVVTTDITVPFDKNIEQSLDMAGGFIKGVCHPGDDLDLIAQANIEWFRYDLPYLYDDDGNISQSYLNWKAEAQSYADKGFKILAVTPYPEDYIEHGLDPRRDEDIKAIQDIAVSYLYDLRGIIGAIQVTNEMGIDRFTYPLTLDEAAKFIGIQLEALYPVRGDILIGYNLGGLSMVQLPPKMTEYHKYCDYVGVDLYLGSFENIFKNIDQNIALIKIARLLTGRPILVCEFGYIGLGEPKSNEEKKAILESYGYSSEAEASADIDNFIANLPPELADEFDVYQDKTPEERANLMFNGEFANHLYRELDDGIGLYNYEHTPEGQAEFFEHILPKMMDLDFVIGTIVYCWEDSGDCYVCGQVDCPDETKWGLVDCEGIPKPSYYAVQKAFADK